MTRSTTQLAWTSERTDRARAAADRTILALDQLSDRYAELPTMLTARSRIDGARRQPGWRAPLRLDVQSLLVETTHASVTWLDQAARVLNVRRPHTGVRGHGDIARTRSRLQLLTTWAPDLHLRDPHAAHQVARHVWRLNTTAARVLGLAAGPFRILNAECPDCDSQTLYADPATLTVSCGIPTCTYRYSLTGYVTRHTTGGPA